MDVLWIWRNTSQSHLAILTNWLFISQYYIILYPSYTLNLLLIYSWSIARELSYKCSYSCKSLSQRESLTSKGKWKTPVFCTSSQIRLFQIPQPFILSTVYIFFLQSIVFYILYCTILLGYVNSTCCTSYVLTMYLSPSVINQSINQSIIRLGWVTRLLNCWWD